MGLRSDARASVADRHWTCARRLRERRRALGLTQTSVGQRLGRAGVPLSNRTLSAMEHGRGIDIGLLPDLAAALDCTVTYLVGLTDDPQRWEPDHPPQLRGADAGAPGPAPVGVGAPPSEHRIWILGPQSPESPS